MQKSTAATIAPPLLDLARRGLFHQIPGMRKAAERLRHSLQRAKGGADEETAAELQALADELQGLLKRTEPRKRASDDGPTRETVAKLRPDPVERLHKNGKLDGVHVRAAEDIEAIFKALTLRLGIAARDYERLTSGNGQQGLPRQPIDGLSDGLAQRYARVFRPWASAMAKTPATRSNIAGGDLFQLSAAVLIDGASLHEVERSMRLRNGSASQALRIALENYATRAGWVSRVAA